MENGLSYKCWLLIMLILTPFTLCMRGGVVSAGVAWGTIGLIEIWKAKQRRDSREALRRAMAYAATPEGKRRAEEKARKSGWITTAQLKEDMAQFGFTVTGSIADHNLIIETHRSMAELREMGKDSARTILGRWYWQTISSRTQLQPYADGRLGLDLDNVCVHVYGTCMDLARGLWTSDCIYMITSPAGQDSFTVYRDGHIEKGKTWREMTESEKRFWCTYVCTLDADGMMNSQVDPRELKYYR